MIEAPFGQPDPIVKSFLFPPIPYFCVFKNSKVVTIDVNENYQKRTLRNRYNVLSANGSITLSIPLRQGKNNMQNIKDVQIAYDEKWEKRHLETLRSSYGKAAYFDHYFPIIEHLYSQKHTYLFDVNLSFLHFVLRSLKYETSIEESLNYKENYTLPLVDSISYPQVFESKFGFVPNLSIVDLIFNMGPEARSFIK